MVNLEKWEVIEHKDIRKGDKLKIVEVRKVNERVKIVTKYKGKVTALYGNGDFDLSDGTEWEEADYPDETVTVYRRTAKPFEFPTKALAIIEGTYRFGSGDTRRYIRTEEGGWRNAKDGGVAFEDALRVNFKDWKVISKGVKA